MGVTIDLIVRGFCRLRPGVAGLSERIHVRSIIGRFLEHARIFHFANGHDDPVAGEFLIGSADWMVRNLSCRVETVTPVHDRGARERLWEILSEGLSDHRQSWEMHSDGSYTRVGPDASDPGVQEVLMARAAPERPGLRCLMEDRPAHRQHRPQTAALVRRRWGSRIPDKIEYGSIFRFV